MPRKAIKKDIIRSNTIADMKKLGMYKPEDERIICIYSELCKYYVR